MHRATILGCALLLGGTTWAQDWPQWRGPNRDNKATGFSVPKEWPKDLTKKWQVTVGVGEACPVLVGNRVYTFGRQGGDEMTMCLDAESSKELWKDRYASDQIRGAAGGYPGPRSTPAVGDGKVCTFGVRGTLSCLDAGTGKVVWRKETRSVPTFYTSTSPLIADGKCVVFAGSLSAYDLATGDVKWQWTGGGAPYGSPVLMTVDGVKQVVTPYSGGLAAVSLANGKLLWQAKVGGGGYQANFSTPLIEGPIVIYSAASKGGSGNTTAFKIEKRDDGFTATTLWKKDQSTHQYHAPLLRDGLIFGVTTGRNFFCQDGKSGEELWRDREKRGQYGSIIDVGPALVSLTSDSNLVAFEPSPKGYKQLATYPVSTSETWSVPILAGNRIYVKDKKGSLTLWTME
jgi:outer membrane protein assembly factor BamB